MSDALDRPEEICSVCNGLTGKAGEGEDSMYYLDGEIGPLCDDCDEKLRGEILADQAGRTRDE